MLENKSSVKKRNNGNQMKFNISNLLIVFGCFFYDLSENNVNYNKNKKIYFYDSFILDVFSKRLNLLVNKEKIIEGIVASQIKQKNVLSAII